MNEHTIVNGIFAVIVVAVFVVRAYRKIAGSVKPADAPPAPAVTPNVTRPAALDIGQIRRRLVSGLTTAAASPAPTAAAMARPVPPAPRPPAPPAPARPPAPPRAPVSAPPAGFPPVEAFPLLDLTLPGADGPAALAPGRRRGRSMIGTGIPGSTTWGAGAIVAMEILGPPVSLRSGATLGAPHAF